MHIHTSIHEQVRVESAEELRERIRAQYRVNSQRRLEMLEQQRASRSHPTLHKSMDSETNTEATVNSKLVQERAHGTQNMDMCTSTRENVSNITNSVAQRSTSGTRITGSMRETLGSRISANQSSSVTTTETGMTKANISAANSDSDSRQVGHVYPLCGSPRSEPSVRDTHLHNAHEHSDCSDSNQSLRREHNHLKDVDSNAQRDRRLFGSRYDHDINSGYIKSTICTDNRRIGGVDTRARDLVHGNISDGAVSVPAGSFFLTQGAFDGEEKDRA
jgi:hypothetical protein